MTQIPAGWYAARSAVVVAVLVLTGCGGVETGTLAEFCEDWAASEAIIADTDVGSEEGLAETTDQLRTMRYPRALADTGADAVATLERLQGDLDGLDYSSAEATAILEAVDTEPIGRLQTFANDEC